jgi:hypothetical protein
LGVAALGTLDGCVAQARFAQTVNRIGNSNTVGICRMQRVSFNIEEGLTRFLLATLNSRLTDRACQIINLKGKGVVSPKHCIRDSCKKIPACLIGNLAPLAWSLIKIPNCFAYNFNPVEQRQTKPKQRVPKLLR